MTETEWKISETWSWGVCFTRIWDSCDDNVYGKVNYSMGFVHGKNVKS